MLSFFEGVCGFQNLFKNQHILSMIENPNSLSKTTCTFLYRGKTDWPKPLRLDKNKSPTKNSLLKESKFHH